MIKLFYAVMNSCHNADGRLAPAGPLTKRKFFNKKEPEDL